MILAAGLGLTLVAGGASATVWDFTFGGKSDDGSGTFTTTGGGSSPFAITGVTGVVDGFTITGLVAPNGYGFNDNELYSTGDHLDFAGVTFAAGGRDFNLFYEPTDPGGFYGIENSNDDPSGFDVQIDPLTSVTLTAVPEPATWLIMIAGLFGVGAFLRRRQVESLAGV